MENIGRTSPTGVHRPGGSNVSPGAAGQITAARSLSIVPNQPAAVAVQPHRGPASIERSTTPRGQNVVLWLHFMSDGTRMRRHLRVGAPANLDNVEHMATEAHVWNILESQNGLVLPLGHQTFATGTVTAFAISSHDYRVQDGAQLRPPVLANQHEHQYRIALERRSGYVENMMIRPRGEESFTVRYERPSASEMGTLQSTASGSAYSGDYPVSLEQRRADIRQFNPQDFSGPPLPSGDSISSQALSSTGSFSQASGSAGAPSRRQGNASARHYHWTAPYAGPSSQPSGSAAASGTSNASGSGQALTSGVARPGARQSSARASLTHPDDLAAFDEFASRAREAERNKDPSYLAVFLRLLRQRGTTWGQFRNLPEDERNGYMRVAVANGYLSTSVPAVVRRAIDPQRTVQPSTARETLTHPDDLAAFDEFAPRARAAGYPSDPGRFAAFLRDLRQHGQGMTWEQFRNRPEHEREQHMSNAVNHRNLTVNARATVRRALDRP